jgi:hypothetical protein
LKSNRQPKEQIVLINRTSPVEENHTGASVRDAPRVTVR